MLYGNLKKIPLGHGNKNTIRDGPSNGGNLENFILICKLSGNKLPKLLETYARMLQKCFHQIPIYITRIKNNL
jgi:hypothetical protein